MFSFLTGPYAVFIKIGGILLLLGGVWGHGWIKGSGHEKVRYNALQAEYVTFKAEVAAEGKQAQERAAAQALSDKKRKETADESHKQTVAALDIAVRGLRSARVGASFVPSAGACPGSPARAGFDRAELERTLREFDTGVQGLVDEGSRAVIGLDNAKVWAQSK